VKRREIREKRREKGEERREKREMLRVSSVNEPYRNSYAVEASCCPAWLFHSKKCRSPHLGVRAVPGSRIVPLELRLHVLEVHPALAVHVPDLSEERRLGHAGVGDEREGLLADGVAGVEDSGRRLEAVGGGGGSNRGEDVVGLGLLGGLRGSGLGQLPLLLGGRHRLGGLLPRHEEPVSTPERSVLRAVPGALELHEPAERVVVDVSDLLRRKEFERERERERERKRERERGRKREIERWRKVKG